MTSRRVFAFAKGVINLRMWEVPEDFSEDELKLFAELCTNGVLSDIEAQACVRQLRH